MRGNLPDIRRHLAVLAASKRSRTAEFSTEMPCEWEPGRVLDPQTNTPFTDAGAWEFIVNLLEQGETIEEVKLKKPPGRTGYVIKYVVKDSTIYIKLQLGSGRVFGRSFHYSKQERDDD